MTFGRRFAWLAVLFGCATSGRLPEVGQVSPGLGCDLLLQGKNEAALRALTDRLAAVPDDSLANFALGTLAYERGQSERAGAFLLRAVELVSESGQPSVDQLTTAALSRLVPILAEVRDRRSFEARLLAIRPDRLPWQAQYSLCSLSLEVARRRGEVALFSARLRSCGGQPSLHYIADGGTMPMLDLAGTQAKDLPKPIPLLSVGVKQQLRADQSKPGVKVLRGEFELTSGDYHLVMDTPLPLRFRVDGGAWLDHAASRSDYEARWSARLMTFSAGRHLLEIRIASYGSTLELGVLAMPAGHSDLVKVGAGNAWDHLVNALAANVSGDSRTLARSLKELAATKQFSLGLAAAGRLNELDPSRPQDILREQAHGYSQDAVVIDPSLARVWTDLSLWETQNDRPREAADFAKKAGESSPLFWPAWTTLSNAYRSLGFDRDADLALARAAEGGLSGYGACGLVQRLFERAEDRERFAEAKQWLAMLETCDAMADRPRQYAREHGDLEKTERLLRAVLPLSNDPIWIRMDLAEIAIARGALSAGRGELESLGQLAPRDTQLVTQLVAILSVLGQADRSRSLLKTMLSRFPENETIRRAARLAGVSLAWEAHRLDGTQVVDAFRAQRKTYDAPQVVVLDRAVEQIQPDGARIILTHSITQVLSKDAIAEVGEAKIPHGAEVLSLRTRKADGQVREAEAIPGKTSISVPDLAVGDFVELETVEVKPPRESFPDGFLSERFYFQSFDAPFWRSEYVLLVPKNLPLDLHARGEAPELAEVAGPDGLRVLTFRRNDSPQLFGERQATPAQEWLPQIAVSSQASFKEWSRFFADRLARTTRTNADLDQIAAELAAKNAGESLPKAIVDWVNGHIEPEKDIWEPATHTLSRGRGNRAGLVLALARRLSLPADFVLARSSLAANVTIPIPPTEFESFADLFVRFPSGEGDRFYDPRLSRSPFGYLLESYVGGKAVVLGSDRIVSLRSTVSDQAQVTIQGDLLPTGEARLTVKESLRGWPALEWRELWEKVGKDEAKQRQEFEQRWLGQHFPGARLVRFEVRPSVEETQIDCVLMAPRFAERSGQLLRLRPLFYRAQPGRRFATEPTRKTGLQIAFTIPMDLTMDLSLAPGLTVLDVGRGKREGWTQGFQVPGIPKAAFLEERSVIGNRLRLHRASRLPNARVMPEFYAAVASVLRQVDVAESSEIILSPSVQVE